MDLVSFGEMADAVETCIGRGHVKIGDEVTVGGPGTCACMPRGVPHAWESARRQHPGHGGRNARNEPRRSRPASSSPEKMVPPLLYVVSREADNVNGYRFEANLLDLSLPPAEAARCAGLRAGFEMHPQS